MKGNSNRTRITLVCLLTVIFLIPIALPSSIVGSALAQADAYQKRAGRVGFDWPDISEVWAKIEEEMGEVRQAEGEGQRDAELGDLLFAVVNNFF